MESTPDANSRFEGLSPAELARELDRLESKLDLVRAEAEANSQLAMLGLFAATLAHELRNVLTPVVSYAHLAQRSPDDPQLVRKSLRQILSGLETAQRVLDSTLERATDRPDPTCAPVCDVRTIANRAVACAGLELRRTRARANVRVPAGMSAAIVPHQLEQVLVNLILNSVRAMEGTEGAAGGRTRIITIRAARESDGSVSIEVNDTGPGFPPEVAPRVFDPFVSARSEGTQSPGGSGLGLAICRRIIADAGGHIRAQNGENGGAVVRFALPAAAQLRKAG